MELTITTTIIIYAFPSHRKVVTSKVVLQIAKVTFKVTPGCIILLFCVFNSWWVFCKCPFRWHSHGCRSVGGQGVFQRTINKYVVATSKQKLQCMQPLPCNCALQPLNVGGEDKTQGVLSTSKSRGTCPPVHPRIYAHGNVTEMNICKILTIN